MGELVDDPRHRFSYELRPDDELDAAIRSLAADLERAGLLAAGSATAPRFQPHLTLLRADRADDAALARVAATVAGRDAVELAQAGAFGAGRIAWLAPRPDGRLRTARAALIDDLGAHRVDPLALARDPWVPHVTVAYAIDEPHRAAALDAIARRLPLRGRWRVAQCWDLDVRPTRLATEAPLL